MNSILSRWLMSRSGKTSSSVTWSRSGSWILRKSQLWTFWGEMRSHPWRPSWTTRPPVYLSANRRSGSSSSGTGSPVRGVSPTATATPRSSTPRSSMKSCPASTTTLTRLSRWRSVQRWLRTSEVSHSDEPSHTNHRGVTWGAPSPPTVATRQVRSSARNRSRSSAVIASGPPRRCSCIRCSLAPAHTRGYDDPREHPVQGGHPARAVPFAASRPANRPVTAGLAVRCQRSQ